MSGVVVVAPVGIAAVVRIPVAVAHMPAAVAHTAHIHLHSSVRQHRILFLSGLSEEVHIHYSAVHVQPKRLRAFPDPEHKLVLASLTFFLQPIQIITTTISVDGTETNVKELNFKKQIFGLTGRTFFI